MVGVRWVTIRTFCDVFFSSLTLLGLEGCKWSHPFLCNLHCVVKKDIRLNTKTSYCLNSLKTMLTLRVTQLFYFQNPPIPPGLKYSRDNSTQISNNVLTSTSTTIHHYGSNILPSYNNAQHIPHRHPQEPPGKGSPYHTSHLIKREGKDGLEGGSEYGVLQHQQPHQTGSGINMPPAWQSIATPGSTGKDQFGSVEVRRSSGNPKDAGSNPCQNTT